MQKNITTRRAEGLRRYNPQNINPNPAYERSRAPQMVREPEFTGDLRSILVLPKKMQTDVKPAPIVNGAPLPVQGDRWGGR